VLEESRLRAKAGLKKQCKSTGTAAVWAKKAKMVDAEEPVEDAEEPVAKMVGKVEPEAELLEGGELRAMEKMVTDKLVGITGQTDEGWIDSVVVKLRDMEVRCQ
jgi:hypothetical protein